MGEFGQGFVLKGDELLLVVEKWEGKARRVVRQDFGSLKS
jgi:hypothetical protein